MIRPIRWIDAQVTRISVWSLREEKALVTEGYEAERRMVFRGVARMILGFAALVWAELVPTPYDAFGWMVVSFLLGMAGFAGSRRAMAYRTGWLDGREALADMLAKHGDDGIKYALSHDLAHVLGAGPVVPDSPEGLS